MKLANLKKAVHIGAAFLLLTLTLFIVNSCRKEIRLGPLSTATDSVNFARQWYESTYPAAGTYSAKQMASVTGQKPALNNFIKPDWKHANSYKRFNKNVVELPLNDSTKLGFSPAKTSFSFDKNASKSSFLIMNDDQNYTAYLMTILADSSYLQNDYTKLARNSYSKRDANFSGFVFYSTPAGNLVKGWHYLNGKVDKTVSPDVSSISGSLQIQSLPASKKTVFGEDCSIGLITVYLGSACIIVGNSETCSDYYETLPTSNCDIQSLSPDDQGGSGSPGFPDPSGQGPPPPVVLTIKEDSLKKHFPCATKLIVDSLQKFPDYFKLVSPFTTNLKPDLVWRDSTGMAWNATIAGSSSTRYEMGLTSSIGRSSTVFLNTAALQNSSQLLIAATAIHETLHAYINYNIQTAVGGFSPPFNPAGSWLYSLDSWALVNGLPANYSDHYQMLSDYFSKAIGILAAWDNNAHTTKEYAEAMLFGLDNAADGSPSQQATLQTEFNNLKTLYNITSDDLNNFNKANLNSASNKLPTSGCN